MSELESHVFTEIEIDTTADQVWAVLTDFEKLPEWSSSFQGVNKPMALGEVSTAYFKNPITGGMMEFTHEVHRLRRGTSLWLVRGCDVGTSGPPHFSDRRAARWAGKIQTRRRFERQEKQFSDPHGRRADW